MFSRTRIVRTLSTGLVVITLGAGLIGGAGVAYGQPIGTSSGGCGANGDLIPPGGDKPIHPEGAVTQNSDGKYICISGKWIPCGDPSLTPSQKAACGAGMTSGNGRFPSRLPSRITIFTSATFTTTAR